MKTIPLTQGQVALVDDEDFEKFGHLKWHAAWQKNTGTFSARRTVNRRRKYTRHDLHREIMGNPDGLKVDHKNHDTLDCRRSNLRICTTIQNGQNRRGANVNSKSGIRGVYYEKARGWRASIRVNKKLIDLGRFRNRSMAASARARAAEEHFGEFAGVP